jgi:hypothetical protein
VYLWSLVIRGSSEWEEFWEKLASVSLVAGGWK